MIGSFGADFVLALDVRMAKQNATVVYDSSLRFSLAKSTFECRPQYQ